MTQQLVDIEALRAAMSGSVIGRRTRATNMPGPSGMPTSTGGRRRSRTAPRPPTWRPRSGSPGIRVWKSRSAAGPTAAGRAVGDDCLMIDLGQLNPVTVDPDAKRGRVQGGATWPTWTPRPRPRPRRSRRRDQPHRRGRPHAWGRNGLAVRLAGLSIDNLVSAEIVVADGRILQVAEDEHADLFWAIRGGGGNFGVVTEFEFQLHEVGPIVQYGLFFWGLDQGADALRLMRELIRICRARSTLSRRPD